MIIFSGCAGQGGDLRPDESRANVYNLYSAMRCEPDTDIDTLTRITPLTACQRGTLMMPVP